MEIFVRAWNSPGCHDLYIGTMDRSAFSKIAGYSPSPLPDGVVGGLEDDEASDFVASVTSELGLGDIACLLFDANGFVYVRYLGRFERDASLRDEFRAIVRLLS